MGVILEIDGELQLGTIVTVINEGLPYVCVVTGIEDGHVEVRRYGRMMDTPFIFTLDGKFERFGFL